jgi:hypothetical protein
MTELGVETNRIEVEGGRTKVERVWFILIVLDCLNRSWHRLGSSWSSTKSIFEKLKPS